MRTFKYIFFKDRSCAERFIKLYGGYVKCITNGDFEIRYFGDKVRNTYCVTNRYSTEEINELIKYIGLKKKKWNGKLCYLYE